MEKRDYPAWVCHDCGVRYGNRQIDASGLIATYHSGTCGICLRTVDVTEPRDYGHFNSKKLGQDGIILI